MFDTGTAADLDSGAAAPSPAPSPTPPPLPTQRPLPTSACKSAELVVAPLGAQRQGDDVTLAAIAECDGLPAEFRWYVLPPGGEWNLARDWGAEEYTRDTRDDESGEYEIVVWARVVGSPSDGFEAADAVAYELVSQCDKVGARALIGSPQRVGSQIELRAGTAGCRRAEYRWYVLPPLGEWTLAQDWGAEEFTWDTSGNKPGEYEIAVWARTVPRRTFDFEAAYSLPYTLLGE